MDREAREAHEGLEDRGDPWVHLEAYPGDACPGVLVEVPNRRDLQSWDHLGVPGRVSREAAFHRAHRDPKGHQGPFLGLQVRTREGTASRLEGRADQMNQGD